MSNNENNKFKEWVVETTEYLGLSHPTVIEKDYYVTKAIHTVSDLETDHFRLVFQGGTALAKAHRLVQRMSEDSDWRIQAKPETELLSKTKKRDHLREFRHDILTALKKEFVIKDPIRTRNEGQFMRINLEYDTFFPPSTGLRPHLQMEFFLAEVKTQTEKLPITTLIRQTMGEHIPHSEKAIQCISVSETAAEKWVALTRRVATMDYRQSYHDQNLVRHIYDLYQIHEHGKIDDRFFNLISDIVASDRIQFKNHNEAYTKDPVREIKRAIYALKHDASWQKHWDNFLDTMVYQTKKPSYAQALTQFENQSKQAIKLLEKSLSLEKIPGRDR